MTVFRRLLKLNWVGDILIPLSVILMETLWLYPWLVFIGEWKILPVLRPPLSIVSIFLILCISLVTTNFFLSRKWSMLWIPAGIILSGILTIFITVRIEYSSGYALFGSEWFVVYTRFILDSFSSPHPIVFAIPAALYLWWRGINLGRTTISFINIYHAFLVELAALVILILAWGISAGAYSIQTITSSIGLHVAGFFFFGLIAMALANLHSIQERMKIKDKSIQTFSRRWLMVITGVIGGLVLIGIGIASIISPKIITFITRVLDSAWDLITKVISYLIIPIAYIVEWLVYIGRLFLNWISGGKTLELMETPEFLNPENVTEGTGNLSPQVILVLKWIIFALLLIAVIFVLYKTISRFRSSRTKEEIDEEQESLWNWGEFKSDLRIFLNMLLGRFKRKRKPLPENVPVYHREADDGLMRLSIREIYRHLLQKTTQYGIPREKDETPYEYARRLTAVIPDGKEPLTELTGLYVDARYGEKEPGEKKIDNANSLWRRLRIMLFR